MVLARLWPEFQVDLDACFANAYANRLGVIFTQSMLYAKKFNILKCIKFPSEYYISMLLWFNYSTVWLVTIPRNILFSLWGWGYVGSYSMTNSDEYFANGLMTYFDVQYPYDEVAPKTILNVRQPDL